MQIRRSIVFLWLISLAIPGTAAPKVVVSIAPVHSLVTGVMEGVGQPVLLFPATSSPHGAGIKPSQVRAIVEADLVIRIDSHFEPAVERVVSRNFSDEAATRIVTLSGISGITLLPARSLDLMEQGHNEEHDEEHGDIHEHKAGELDPHIWLSVENAAAIVKSAAANLARIDPVNADRYRRNADKMQVRFTTTRATISEKLQGLGRQWLLFHDAYQYFEKEYGLAPASIATPDPQRAVSGKRLVQLVDLVEHNKVKCIFVEPQLRSDVVTMLAERFDLAVLLLDPLGSDITPGKELWFEVMLNMAEQMRQCR